MFDVFGNGTISPTAQWKPDPSIRGTSSILQSCIATLILAVWSAVHLNVPEIEEDSNNDDFGSKPSRFKRWYLKGKQVLTTKQTWRKGGCMILALLAPEIVAFTAWQQMRRASEILEEFGTISSEVLTSNRVKSNQRRSLSVLAVQDGAPGGEEVEVSSFYR